MVKCATACLSAEPAVAAGLRSRSVIACYVKLTLLARPAHPRRPHSKTAMDRFGLYQTVQRPRGTGVPGTCAPGGYPGPTVLWNGIAACDIGGGGLGCVLTRHSSA